MNRSLSKANFYRQAREADHIICVSDYTKRRVIELSNIDESLVTVIGCGVTPPPARSADAQLNSVSQELANQRFVLVLGNVEPRKNIASIIRAWATIQKTHPDLKLIVAGRKNYQADCDIELGKSLLGEAFQYLGSVSESAKWWLLENAAVVAIPSFYEGYGIPVIEAYSAGTPAVFSNTTSLAELALDPRQTFDPLSSDEIALRIIESVDGPSWVGAVVAEARTVSSALTWDAVARKTTAVYEKVLGS